MVFFGTSGYNGSGVPSPFYALNGSTGALEWSLILPWDEYAFPTLANNTLYFNGFVAAPPGFPASADLIWTGTGSNDHWLHNTFTTSTPGHLP